MSHKIIKTCVFLTSLILSTHSIASNNNPKGFSCDAMECKLKIKKLKQYARNGSSFAQEIVGTAYLTGEGLEQNPEKAISYFKKSMKQGSGRASWLLFSIYHFGMGVSKDEIKAKDYLDFAVNKKDKRALYYKGAALLVDDKNSQEALDLLTEASELKESNATYLLADYYAQQPANNEKEQGALLFLQLKADNFKDSANKYDAVMALLSPHSKTNILQQSETIEHITRHKLPVIEQLDNAIASLADVYDSPSVTGTRIKGNHKSSRKIQTLFGNAAQEYVITRMLKGGSLFTSQNR
jgi:tetratricopeptide (TPR) repeat protein